MRKEEIILSRKIKSMLQKNKRRIYKDISPIHYYVLNNQPLIRLILASDFQDTQYQLSIHGGNFCRSNNHFNIKIDSIEFIKITSKSSLFNFTIPEKIKYLLIRGKFRLLSFNKKRTLLEFIKNIENNFRKIKPNNILSIRNCTSILKNYLLSFVRNNIIHKRLTQLV